MFRQILIFEVIFNNHKQAQFVYMVYIYFLGAWDAIKHHFPNADIKDCVFHWGQAVMRKVAKLGLKTAHDQKQAIHIFI